MSSIKVSTGIKSYDIEDEFGKVRGQISFNPTDMNFITRLANLQDQLNSILIEASKLDDVLTSPSDSNEAIIEAYTLLTEFDAKTKEAINKTFDDDNLSNVIFGNQSVFNLDNNGTSFLERFIMGVLPIIERDINASAQKMQKNINKYTNNLVQE